MWQVVISSHSQGDKVITTNALLKYGYNIQYHCGILSCFNNLIISPSSRGSIYEGNTHTSYAALQKTEQFQSITHHRWLAYSYFMFVCFLFELHSLLGLDNIGVSLSFYFGLVTKYSLLRQRIQTNM